MQLLHIKLLGALSVTSALLLSGCGGGASPKPNNDGPFTFDGTINNRDFYDSNDDRNYDIYQTDVTRNGTAEVNLDSNDFDAQIFVYRRNSNGDYGSVIAQNDDISGSNSNARVTFDVKRGEIYRIIATSSRKQEFGNYRIFFSRELGRPLPVPTSNNGRTAPGFTLPAIQPKEAKKATQ